MLPKQKLRGLIGKPDFDFHYYIKGSFWLYISQGAVILGSLIVTVAFAHILSESDFGIYKYILGIGVLLTSFSLTGIGQSILQTTSKGHPEFFAYGIKQSHIYGISITLAGLIGFIYYFINGNPTLATGCLLIGLFQPFINTYQQIFFFLQGSKQLQQSAIFQTLKTIAVTLSSILSIYFTQNILILVTVFLLSHVLTNFIGYIFYKRNFNVELSNEIRIKYLHYAQHTSIRNLIANVVYRLDTILVFQMLGAPALAVYTIANIVPEQIKGSFKNISTLLIPKYVQHENLNSVKSSLLKRSTQLFVLLSFITIIYVLAAPFLYSLRSKCHRKELK